MLVILLSQCYILYQQENRIAELDALLESKASVENVSKGIRFLHTRIDDLNAALDGTWGIASAAWEMANPNSPPSENNSVEYLTTEELDSVWRLEHGWTKKELEHWRYTGERPDK